MIYLSLVEYVLHKFLTSICVVSSIRKIVSLLTIVLTNINKSVVGSLWDRNLTQGNAKNIPWVVFQEHTHPFIETSSRGSCNSEEFDLDNLFSLLRSLFLQETGKLLEKPTLNTCQALEISNKFAETSSQPAP